MVEILSLNSLPVALATASLSKSIIVFGEDYKSFVKIWEDSKSFEIAIGNAGEIIEGGKARGGAREVIEDGRVGENAGKSREIVESKEIKEFAAQASFFFNLTTFAFAFRSTLIFSSHAAFSSGVWY